MTYNVLIFTAIIRTSLAVGDIWRAVGPARV